MKKLGLVMLITLFIFGACGSKSEINKDVNDDKQEAVASSQKLQILFYDEYTHKDMDIILGDGIPVSNTLTREFENQKIDTSVSIKYTDAVWANYYGSDKVILDSVVEDTEGTTTEFHLKKDDRGSDSVVVYSIKPKTEEIIFYLDGEMVSSTNIQVDDSYYKE